MSEQLNEGEIPVLNVEVEAPPTVSVGQQLRSARLARGLALPDVAQTLKLGVRQIEALENGDWQGLPGQTFIRGFVRNYARLLQVDAGPLMLQLDSILEKPAKTLAVPEGRLGSMPQTGGSISRRDRAVILSGIGLVAVAGLVYFLLPNDLSSLRESTQGLLDSFARKEAPAPVAASAPEPVFPPGSTPQQIMNPQAEPVPPAPAEVAAPAPAPAAPAAAPAAAVASEQKAPVPGAAQLRFVFDKESWVEVRDRDDRIIFSQRPGSGAERQVAGQGPLSLVIGYAPGVKLYWRGELIDLVPHTRGDVARLVLE